MLDAPDPTPAAELEQLAVAVRRLSPSWQNPERYHEQKSEIAGALLRLSRRLAGKAMPAPMPIRRPVMRAPIAPPIRVVAVAPVPLVLPRRMLRPRHRYPRPPPLSLDVQLRLL
jgi:hypothetical protein